MKSKDCTDSLESFASRQLQSESGDKSIKSYRLEAQEEIERSG